MIIRSQPSRRSVLRGLLNGAAVSVALPFLDGFLNENGTALAATGTPLPVRFGTWFWGCGLNPGRWEPKKTGADYEITPELQPLDRFRSKLNVYSGLKVFLDGKPNVVHFSGAQACVTGTVPRGPATLPSIDVLVADTIGGNTRFRSLDVSCSGDPAHSQSRRAGTGGVNPGEVSPAALYARIFGPEYQDPNAAEFSPDVGIMVRQSALSVVTEQRQRIMKSLGANDRARLDEYFTSVRQLEQQVELQLQKPAPLEACRKPGKPSDTSVGTDVELVKANHKLFAGLLANALACGQTRVINVALINANSSLRRPGATQTHHEYTHEEPVDPKLGYQPEMTSFYGDVMAAFGDLLTALDGIREGDRTLLDRSVVLACTDTGYAKVHSLENMPMLTAGGANGRLKTGIHVNAAGDAVSRVGLTLQQALGVSVSSWGTESQQTSKAIGEILV
jgi:hypothetical protein